KGRLKQVTYPVADLVVPVKDYPPSEVFSLEEQLRRHQLSQYNMISSGSTPFPGPNSMMNGQTVSPGHSGTNRNSTLGGPPHAKPTGQSIEQELISLITNTVAPESWDGVGGQGHIQFFPLGMALVVNQAQEVQEDVATLLAALRKLQDLEVAIEIKMVT